MDSYDLNNEVIGRFYDRLALFSEEELIFVRQCAETQLDISNSARHARAQIEETETREKAAQNDLEDRILKYKASFDGWKAQRARL
jgi:hypothetical protein